MEKTLPKIRNESIAKSLAVKINDKPFESNENKTRIQSKIHP